MRLIGNARRRDVGAASTPLEICPGRQIWEKHRNCEYLVFVDESFYRFFGFEAVDGNFCHAAIGVPVDNYSSLQKLLAPALDSYGREVARATGVFPGELKFSTLRQLPIRFRVAFTKVLVRSLVETGGFISGFYTSTRGMVMERVRTNLLDESDAVPNTHEDLYASARTELLGQFRGVGQAELIKRLMLTPVASIISFLRSFDCVFEVRYDPRQEDEDQEVRRAISEYAGLLKRVPEIFGAEDVCLGIEVSIRSDEDLGLQLADVVVGEVREFFRNNQEFLQKNATLGLITPESDEPLQQFEEMHNRTFKVGALSPIPPTLLRRISRPNIANLLSYYYRVLAAGMLTCVTDTGQPRHIEVPTRLFFDQLD